MFLTEESVSKSIEEKSPSIWYIWSLGISNDFLPVYLFPLFMWISPHLFSCPPVELLCTDRGIEERTVKDFALGKMRLSTMTCINLPSVLTLDLNLSSPVWDDPSLGFSSYSRLTPIRCVLSSCSGTLPPSVILSSLCFIYINILLPTAWNHIQVMSILRTLLF